MTKYVRGAAICEIIMRPLGNENKNSLSRAETLRMKKADKAKGRQKSKKEVNRELAGMCSFVNEDHNVRGDS